MVSPRTAPAAALTLEIDGTRPPGPAAVAELTALLDRAEDAAARRPAALVTLHVTGAPAEGWTRDLDVARVTKWERALRRLERAPATTVALATGDVGGTALDALLVTDLRWAAPGTRLLVADDGHAPWPGMAAHRLVQQAGAGRVRRAVLFGRPITAPEAVAYGLLDEIAEDPAAALAAHAPQAAVSGKDTAIRRQLLLDAVTGAFEDALGPHLAATDRALRQSAAPAPGTPVAPVAAGADAGRGTAP
jgi:isomerase DpgB